MDKGPLNHAISPWHSIGVRLSLSVLGVAIGVLVVGLLVYIYFQEDQVKEKTMMLAEMQLTEQICEAEKLMVGDTTLTDKEKEDSVMRIIQSIKPFQQGIDMNNMCRNLCFGIFALLSHFTDSVFPPVYTVIHFLCPHN